MEHDSLLVVVPVNPNVVIVIVIGTEPVLVVAFSSR